MPDRNTYILIAEIGAPHGIKGFVKVTVYAEDPHALVSYSPLCDENGQESLSINKIMAHGKIWLAQVDGITDRNSAESLKGLQLYVPRDTLPDIDNDGVYYHADLQGLNVYFEDGTHVGQVANVVNFGAGDLLDIHRVKGTGFYLPFNDDCVPNVDLKGGRITITPPDGLID